MPVLTFTPATLHCDHCETSFKHGDHIFIMLQFHHVDVCCSSIFEGKDNYDNLSALYTDFNEKCVVPKLIDGITNRVKFWGGECSICCSLNIMVMVDQVKCVHATDTQEATCCTSHMFLDWEVVSPEAHRQVAAHGVKRPTKICARKTWLFASDV